MKLLPYDETSKESILQYAKKLENKTFNDIINLFNERYKSTFEVAEDDENYDIENFKNKYAKGSLGQLLEKYYFLYSPNSNSSADFNKAGIELKMSPFKITKKGNIVAKERLVLTIINYMEDYKEDDFFKSHVYQKCMLMLLIYYLYEPTKDKLDYIIKYVSLFSFPDEDLSIIKNDYKIIIDKIKKRESRRII